MKIISDKVKPLEKKQIFILVGSFVGVLFLISIIITICITATAKDEEHLELSPEQIVDQALTLQPIIDGNNKFPWSLRKLVQNDLSKVNFSSESSPGQGNLPQTDLPRLRKGRIGAVFWSAYVDCSSQHKDAVVQTLEQVDVIQRLIQQYSTSLHLSTSAQDIEDAIGSEKIASIIALGGGHSIQSSLATLRQFHQLGVRVMQLTDDCNTPWASAAATASDSTSGLTQFGHMVISEMNRLGIIVDLSRSSLTTAKEVIVASKAPVIFSSSGAYSLCPHHQNVPDEILDLVKEYKGVVMVGADVHKDSCGNQGASIEDIADHINYIRNMTSSENIGIGGGFDGNDKAAGSLDNPSRYPDLFRLLAETGGWSVEDLRKLAGGNILRVFKAVEQARDIPQGPIQTWISFAEITNHNVSLNCMTTNYPNATLFRIKG